LKEKNLAARVQDIGLSKVKFDDKVKQKGKKRAEPSEDLELDLAKNDDIANAQESDEENDSSQLVHESVAEISGKGRRLSAKTKHVPEDETSGQRDARTIFVGNLSVEISQKKVRLLSLSHLYLRFNLDPSPSSSNYIVTSYL
jgi:hypothetical protein